MKIVFVISLFLPSHLYGFNTCCKKGELLDIQTIGSYYPPCLTNHNSFVSEKDLLVGHTPGGVKYPVECTELEYFEVKIHISV